MTFTNAIMLIIVLQGSLAFSQTIPTEKAAPPGPCSTVLTGDNNTYNVNCTGIGLDQGKKIVEILIGIVINPDPPTVNAKQDATISGNFPTGSRITSASQHPKLGRHATCSAR
jgi:hypothetical protein